MATITRTETLCDLCSSLDKDEPAMPGGQHTLALNDDKVLIDLCEDHTKSFLDQIGDWMQVGTPLKKRAKTPIGPDSAKVREWAKTQKIAVSERGRIPQVVLDAYLSGHSATGG